MPQDLEGSRSAMFGSEGYWVLAFKGLPIASIVVPSWGYLIGS